MFPVVAALQQHGGFELSTIVTGQHRELLDQVLSVAGLVPDFDLDLMSHGQSLDELASNLLLQLGRVLDQVHPDRVLVHGDTLTTMMAAQACYFRKIPVAHVEAGLRSGNIYSPWPEEVSRKLTATIADVHFAPTKRAAAALVQEAVPAARIMVTGNTAIDALFHTLATADTCQPASEIAQKLRRLCGEQKTILVTMHRRENHGAALDRILSALKSLAQSEDINILFPVHPNGKIKTAVYDRLNNTPNIHLLPPLSYPDFIQALRLSDIILTDSGGIQEEAPALGKPVLVLRNETERPEAIEAGVARLVGTQTKQIIRETQLLLHDTNLRLRMSRQRNPFGDGRASDRIVSRLAAIHGVAHERSALSNVA